jgi:hypothetical protein
VSQVDAANEPRFALLSIILSTTNPSAALIFSAIDLRPHDRLYTAEHLQTVSSVWSAVFSVCKNTQSIAHTIEILVFLANDGPTTVNSAGPIFGKSAQILHPKFIRAVESGLVERYQSGPKLEWHYRIPARIPCEYIFDAFTQPL